MSRRESYRSRSFMFAAAAGWLALCACGTARAGLSTGTRPPSAAAVAPADPAAPSPAAARAPEGDGWAAAELPVLLAVDLDSALGVTAAGPATTLPEEPAPALADEARVPGVAARGVVIPAHPAAWIGGVTLLLAAAVTARLRHWLA